MRHFSPAAQARLAARKAKKRSKPKTKEKDPGVKWFNVEFYPENYSGHAVHYHERDGVLDRLRQPTVTFFTPWGPRYSWERRGTEILPEHKEMQTLQHLANLFEQMKNNMPRKQWRWVFVGADLYGTRINKLPEEAVFAYFESLKRRLGEMIPEAEFHLWSTYDAQVEEKRRLIREKGLRELIPGNVLLGAQLVAGKGAFTGSAMDYLVERIAEAQLVEELFHPATLESFKL